MPRLADTAPRDHLIRAVAPGIEARADDDGGDGEGLPTLFGHFAVFDQWTEIHSWYEGDFLESIAPGAFAQTFREDRDSMKVLYDHGYDPQLGNKPLGPIRALSEDKVGAYYEVPLIDTDYNRGFIIPAVDAGLLGASFRFSVLADTWDEEPEPSDHNPKGLPERRITKIRNYEMGPVTFPAYQGTDQGLRSVALTDAYIERSLGDEEARSRLVTLYPDLRSLATNAAGPAAGDPGALDEGSDSNTTTSHAVARAAHLERITR